MRSGLVGPCKRVPAYWVVLCNRIYHTQLGVRMLRLRYQYEISALQYRMICNARLFYHAKAQDVCGTE